MERLVRLKHRIFDVIPEKNIDKFGNEGEDIVANLIKKYNYDFVKYNPVFPDPKNKSKYLETDIIIYHKGTIFCIEIKNLKGSLSIEYRNNTKKLIQKKVGNYGEEIPEKIYDDPLSKTKSYIVSLKKYLSRKNKDFGNMYIHSIVVFNREICNLDEIYENNYIYFDQINEYIQNTVKEDKKNQDWCEKLLNSLASWDILTTVKNKKFYGFIMGEFLHFKDKNEKPYNIRKKDISNIIIYNNNFLSKEYGLTVNFNNCAKKNYKNLYGEIRFFNKSGVEQIFYLDTLKKIEIGSNKLRIINKK